jgi:hypothetical protein
MKSLLPILCLLPAPSFAAFVLIDNFDSGYALGALNGQNGWTNAAPGGWTVAAAPAGGVGNVATATTTTANLFASKQLSLAIPNTSTSTTLFFRLRRNGGVNMSVGLTDIAVPAAVGDYETQINAQHNAAPNDSFKVRDGTTTSQFDDLGAGTFAIDTWYNVWMIVNNSADTYELYIDQGNFGSPVLALTHIQDPASTPGGGDFTFLFRNSTAALQGNPLTSVFLAMGNATVTGSLFVDDLYIDSSGQNLSNPTAVPEPSSAVAVVGGAACLLGLTSRRRRG